MAMDWHERSGSRATYIYRQFVPLIARLVSQVFGASIDQSVVVVIILCSIGFAFSSHYLYSSFYGPTAPGIHAELFVISKVCILFLIIAYPKHIYDVLTFFFKAISDGTEPKKEYFDVTIDQNHFDNIKVTLAPHATEGT
jgi:hypothetical protein